jgi:hypothetical protein
VPASYVLDVVMREGTYLIGASGAVIASPYSHVTSQPVRRRAFRRALVPHPQRGAAARRRTSAAVMLHDTQEERYATAQQ